MRQTLDKRHSGKGVFSKSLKINIKKTKQFLFNNMAEGEHVNQQHEKRMGNFDISFVYTTSGRVSATLFTFWFVVV